LLSRWPVGNALEGNEERAGDAIRRGMALHIVEGGTGLSPGPLAPAETLVRGTRAGK
jgi:hypothetical protein